MRDNSDQLDIFDYMLLTKEERAALNKIKEPVDGRYRNGLGQLLPWELPEGESYD